MEQQNSMGIISTKLSFNNILIRLPYNFTQEEAELFENWVNSQYDIYPLEVPEPFSTKPKSTNETTIHKSQRQQIKIEDDDEMEISVFSLIKKEQLEIITSKLKKRGYDQTKYISRGDSSEIFGGTYLRDGLQQKCTFKILKDRRSNLIEQEVKIGKILEHCRNIVRYIEFVPVSSNISVIVQEQCQTTLKKKLEFIQEFSHRFSLKRFFKIILDLFDGLITLKLFKVLHLDIKPANILISEEGNYIYSDFSVAQRLEEGCSPQIIGFTINYASIEQLQLKSKLVGYKSDVQSLGKTIKNMFETFKGARGNESYHIIEKFEKEIVEQMLETEIEKRPDCFQCRLKLIDMLFIQNMQYHFKIFLEYQRTIQWMCNQIPLVMSNFNNNPLLKNQIFYSIVNIQMKEWGLLIFKNNPQKKETLTCKQKIFQLNIDICDSLDNIGLCYFYLGRYDDAVKHMLSSLKMKKELFNRNHPSLASSLKNIGLCYNRLGDSKKALGYHLDSLKKYKELFQGNHPDVAASLSNVGLSYSNTGHYADALIFQIDSLSMYRQLFKGNHLEIASSLNNLGLSYLKICDYKKALNYLSESLEMRKELSQGNNTDQAISLYNIGLCYYYIGDFKKALISLFESLEMKKSQNNRDQSDIVNCRIKIALCYHCIGDEVVASNYQKEASQMKYLAQQ